MTPFEITLLTFILIQILIFFCYKFTVSKLKRKNKPFRAFLLACYLSISFLLLSFYLELYDVSFFMNHKKNIHLITSFFISFTVIRFLKSFIWNGKIISRGKLIPKIITKVFHALIYFIALAITLNFVFNQSITPYLAISGATAAFIGFIAKDGISQILAGLSINLAKNINKGNLIMIGKNGDIGKIIEMDWRSVTLRLKTGPLLIIPNNTLTTSKIINFSATKKTCLAQSYFYFPGYIHSQKIINILKYTFKQLKLEKKKCAYYIKRNENNYCLKIYHPANSTDIMTEKSNFIELYSHNLYKSGIYFDTLTRLNDLSKQSLKLDNNQQLDINKIKKIPFIKTLSEKDSNTIIESITLKTYGPKSILLREGENNNNLFIILTGKIILSSLSKSNKRTYLSSLKENSLVGLNGALNNQPELTTATTNKESTIAILGTKALETVLKNPKTLKILNDTLKGQRSDEHLKKITHKKSTKLTEQSLLHSIKNKLFKKKKNS